MDSAGNDPGVSHLRQGVVKTWDAYYIRASQVVHMAKNPHADARDEGNAKKPSLGLWRSPGVGNGNPLHSYCLEIPMDRGAWRVIVHGVAKSWTQLSTHTPHVTYCLKTKIKFSQKVFFIQPGLKATPILISQCQLFWESLKRRHIIPKVRVMASFTQFNQVGNS